MFNHFEIERFEEKIMLLDLLNTNDYISFNVQLAKIFGLSSAVYCSELINIYQKAIRKNKLIDGRFFKLDRKYMSGRTTLSVEEQLLSDSQLMKIGLLEKHRDNPDLLRLDVNMLVSILSEEDESVIKELSGKLKIKTKSEVKETKRQSVINALKNSIECSNYELLTALRNWVDSIYEKPNGYLSKTAIKSFQDTLNNYTQGDLDLALRLVEIASIQGYKDCSWAINVYERDLKFAKSNENFAQTKLPRVTEQKIANEDTIDKKVVY